MDELMKVAEGVFDIITAILRVIVGIYILPVGIVITFTYANDVMSGTAILFFSILMSKKLILE